MKPMGSYIHHNMKCTITKKSLVGIWEAYRKSEEEWKENIEIIKLMTGNKTHQLEVRLNIFSYISRAGFYNRYYKLVPNTSIFRKLYKTKLLAYWSNFILVEK